MEINSNLVVNAPSVANASGEAKTGLQRVTEAIESGNKIRQALSGDNEGDRVGGSAGGNDTSEIIKSIKEMIKMLEKQIQILQKEQASMEDPAMQQALSAQIMGLEAQLLKLNAQLLELGGGIDFSA